MSNDVDTHDLSGDVLIPNGDKRASDPGFVEIQRSYDGQHDEREDEVIELPLRPQLPSEQDRMRDADGGLRATRNGVSVIDQPLDDHLCRERRYDKIDPADPQRWQTDHDPHESGHGASGRDGHPERGVQRHDQVGRGVGPDGHEGALSYRDLPGFADENVESDRPDNRDQRQICDGEPVVRRNDGNDEQRHAQ